MSRVKHETSHSHQKHGDHNGGFATQVSHVKESLDDLRTDVGELVSSAVVAGKSGVQAVQDRVADRAADAMDQVNERIAALKKSGRGLITENPVTSAIIAIGIGYILARIMRRK